MRNMIKLNPYIHNIRTHQTKMWDEFTHCVKISAWRDVSHRVKDCVYDVIDIKILYQIFPSIT